MENPVCKQCRSALFVYYPFTGFSGKNGLILRYTSKHNTHAKSCTDITKDETDACTMAVHVTLSQVL